MDEPVRVQKVDFVAHAAAHPDAAADSLYEVRRKIYPRALHGWFAAWRWVLVLKPVDDVTLWDAGRAIYVGLFAE